MADGGFGIGGLISGLTGSFLSYSSAQQQQRTTQQENRFDRLENREMMQKAQDYNTSERIAQQDYQTGMSNSAYQRSVADMKKAGLNPMLAGINQSSASSPSGSAGSVSAPTARSNPSKVADVGAIVKDGLSSAMEIGRYFQDMKKTDAEVDLTEAAALTKRSEEFYNYASARGVTAGAIKTGKETERIATEMPAISAEAKLRKREAGASEPYVETNKTLDYINKLIGTGSSALQMLNPLNYLKSGKTKKYMERAYGEGLRDGRGQKP